ncbi:hypothetical protein B0H12DRAFT_1229034 [Mycena haematopus]|nr:hypothetical protein B0H12DRAFT_1229034 [Mycena haematopus]
MTPECKREARERKALTRKTYRAEENAVLPGVPTHPAREPSSSVLRTIFDAGCHAGAIGCLLVADAATLVKFLQVGHPVSTCPLYMKSTVTQILRMEIVIVAERFIADEIGVELENEFYDQAAGSPVDLGSVQSLTPSSSLDNADALPKLETKLFNTRPWTNIISECIMAADSSSGVSRTAIKKYAEEKLNISLTPTVLSCLNRTIQSGIKSGIFFQPRGASGSIKMAPAILRENIVASNEMKNPRLQAERNAEGQAALDTTSATDSRKNAAPVLKKSIKEGVKPGSHQRRVHSKKADVTYFDGIQETIHRNSATALFHCSRCVYHISDGQGLRTWPGILWHAGPGEYRDTLVARKRCTDGRFFSVNLLFSFLSANATIDRLTAHNEITFALFYAILVPCTLVVARCAATGPERFFRLTSAAASCAMTQTVVVARVSMLVYIQWVGLMGCAICGSRGQADAAQRASRASLGSDDRATFHRLNANYSFPMPVPHKNESDELDANGNPYGNPASILYGPSNSTKVLPVQWNEDAVANLVLLANRKTLLRSLVEAQAGFLVHLESLTYPSILPSPPPYLCSSLLARVGFLTGKSVSAEATSEHVELPLHVNGSSTSQLIKADVFLGRRSSHDLECNAMRPLRRVLPLSLGPRDRQGGPDGSTVRSAHPLALRAGHGACLAITLTPDAALLRRACMVGDSEFLDIRGMYEPIVALVPVPSRSTASLLRENGFVNLRVVGCGGGNEGGVSIFIYSLPTLRTSLGALPDDLDIGRLSSENFSFSSPHLAYPCPMPTPTSPFSVMLTGRVSQMFERGSAGVWRELCAPPSSYLTPFLPLFFTFLYSPLYAPRWECDLPGAFLFVPPHLGHPDLKNAATPAPICLRLPPTKLPILIPCAKSVFHTLEQLLLLLCLLATDSKPSRHSCHKALIAQLARRWRAAGCTIGVVPIISSLPTTPMQLSNPVLNVPQAHQRRQRILYVDAHHVIALHPQVLS